MRFWISIRSIAAVIVCTSAVLLDAGGPVSPAKAEDRNIWLNDGAQTSITGYFLAGEDIYASCDADCTDINLFLYTELGTLVDADEAADSFPTITAPHEGTFSVQVSMPACHHSAGCSVSLGSDYGF